MKLEELKTHKKILILGYGVEGKATEDFLKKNVPGVEVRIADKADGDDYLNKQEWADLVIKTPSIRSSLVTKPYTTATNIFFANTEALIIGITGSKGKSTTASLVYHILKIARKNVYLAGNIGNAMIALLDKTLTKDDIVVLELSSYQLADIHYSPHIAVFLNIYNDHQRYHESFQNYFDAKANIIKFQKKGDYFVYNPHFPQIASLAESSHGSISSFTETDIHDMVVASLKGSHNENNIRAAVCVTSIFDIPRDTIADAIATFKPLNHRMQEVGVYKGILFIDDGAATTPEATVCSLQTFPQTTTLLVGGEDRDYDFSKLAQEIASSKVHTIIAFPQSGHRIADEAVKLRPSLKIYTAMNMKQAVSYAFESTDSGGVVLLSSASPSYSLWKNFVEKGIQYKAHIKAYDEKTREKKTTDDEKS